LLASRYSFIAHRLLAAFRRQSAHFRAPRQGFMTMVYLKKDRRKRGVSRAQNWAGNDVFFARFDSLFCRLFAFYARYFRVFQARVFARIGVFAGFLRMIAVASANAQREMRAFGARASD